MHDLSNDYVMLRMVKARQSDLLNEARNERILMMGADRLRDQQRSRFEFLTRKRR